MFFSRIEPDKPLAFSEDQALRVAVPIEMMSWLKDPFATFVQAETPTDSARMVLRKIRFGSKL